MMRLYLSRRNSPAQDLSESFSLSLHLIGGSGVSPLAVPRNSQFGEPVARRFREHSTMTLVSSDRLVRRTGSSCPDRIFPRGKLAMSAGMIRRRTQCWRGEPLGSPSLGSRLGSQLSGGQRRSAPRVPSPTISTSQASITSSSWRTRRRFARQSRRKLRSG